ncbi:MAG: hypothetical protein V4591_04930 [Bdellovibrionota bacterium]
MGPNIRKNLRLPTQVQAGDKTSYFNSVKEDFYKDGREAFVRNKGRQEVSELFHHGRRDDSEFFKTELDAAANISSQEYNSQSNAKNILDLITDYTKDLKTHKNEALRERTIQFFNALRALIPNESNAGKTFDKKLTSLIDLGDIMINRFQTPSDDVVTEYFLNAAQLWQDILTEMKVSPDKSQELNMIGVAVISVSALCLTYQVRTGSEKGIIWLKRFIIPVLFGLHEGIGYILAVCACPPIAAVIGASGAIPIIAVLTFIAGWAILGGILYGMNSLLNSAQEKEKARSSTSKASVKTKLSLTPETKASNNLSLSVSLEEAQSIVSKASDHQNLSSLVGEIKNISSCSNEEEKTVKLTSFFNSLKTTFNIEDAKIHQLFYLAHLLSNNFEEFSEELMEAELAKVALEISNNILKEETIENKEGLAVFLQENILHFSKLIAHNNKSLGHKSAAKLLFLVTLGAVDFAADNAGVGSAPLFTPRFNNLGLPQLVSGLLVNLIGLAAQGAVFFLGYLIKPLVSPVFQKWNQNTIQIPNQNIQKNVDSYLQAIIAEIEKEKKRYENNTFIKELLDIKLGELTLQQKNFNPPTTAPHTHYRFLPEDTSSDTEDDGV